jgi:hypothetical protein
MRILFRLMNLVLILAAVDLSDEYTLYLLRSYPYDSGANNFQAADSKFLIQEPKCIF